MIGGRGHWKKKRARNTIMVFVAIFSHRICWVKSSFADEAPLQLSCRSSRLSRQRYNPKYCLNQQGTSHGIRPARVSCSSQTRIPIFFAVSKYFPVQLGASPSHSFKALLDVSRNACCNTLSFTSYRHFFSTTSSYSYSHSNSAALKLFLRRDENNNNNFGEGILDVDDESAWKELTDSLMDVVELPSMSFPSKHVHFLLCDHNSPITPYLAAHNVVELEGVHPKIKLVREEHDNEQDRHLLEQQRSGKNTYEFFTKNSPRKRIMLNLLSTTTLNEDTEHNDSEYIDKNTQPQPFSLLPKHDYLERDENILQLRRKYPGIPRYIIQRLVDDYDAKPSHLECIRIPYHNQPISRILSKILSQVSLVNKKTGAGSNDDSYDDECTVQMTSPPSSYEQIGHVAHFNLRQPYLPYGKLIGRVMLDRLQPSIRTVVNKLGEVGGPYRTYQMDLLAGVEDYYVHVVEHGISLHFDLQKVYWCTRLEGERTYLIKNEFQPNQFIADAFCGVGALCIRAALAKGCSVVANDLNPDAVKYCIESAKRNGIEMSEKSNKHGKFQVQCGDASQFIMNLGMNESSSTTHEISHSTSNTVDRKNNLPDHLLLNYPLDSPRFLNALRWWPSGLDSCKSPPTRVHVYTFCRGDDERTASEVAIDVVANGLLPEGGYVEPSKYRGQYLNELGCNIHAREIRDAAPGKLVVCVSFSVTRLLLRRMQGDYGLNRE